jgi:hypothetical protein
MLNLAVRLSFLVFLAITTVSVRASASACDDKCLRQQLETYLEALVRRDPSGLNLASTVRYTENGVTEPLGKGLWKEASGLGAYRQYFTDSVSQQAMFIGVVDEGANKAILTLRLGVEGGKIAEVEHIVARKGSHPLFAPEAFTSPHVSLSTPVENKLSRARLVEIANTYFEGIEQHDSKIILSSDDCQRIENGVQTTSQPGRTSRNCAHSADLLTYIRSVDNRRFPIVDPDHGIVVSIITFGIPGETRSDDTTVAANPQVAARLREPRTLLLMEWFKIDDGKMQRIEAVMHNLPYGASSGWNK